MCGLAGFISFSSKEPDFLKNVATRMGESIISRGPDDSGVWIERNLSMAFSFRRLAILDLSDAGSQPMQSQSGRYVICFNGEIYNHLELRKLLPNNTKWKGHSDTETILSVIEAYGIEKSLQMFEGMFAFCIFDRSKKSLILARDRLGEKPLYYGWTGQAFLFGSELKAIRQYPDFNNPISKEALANFLRYNYIPAPHSIYQDFYKLIPGSYIEINTSNPNYKDLQPIKYWSLSDVIINGRKNIIHDPNDAKNLVKDALKKSVKKQMISDVPLGAFLSGGIDSSLITAMMQEESMSPIKTFTIGFEESNFDESIFAKDVAKYLGSDHTEHFVTPKETLGVIPNLSTIYDEPFADSSQIPTYLVCQQAKKRLTVALSGDGGDEVFGGYNRYFWSSRIWNKINWIPFPLRKILGSGIELMPKKITEIIGQGYNYLNTGNLGIDNFFEKTTKMAKRMQTVQYEDDLYHSLISQWDNPYSLIKDYKFNDKTEIYFPDIGLTNQASKMMYWDSISYLPDDILCKVDRAAMSVSLETRAPFLDHNLIELAWKLPNSLRISNNIGKVVLRDILSEYVPDSLVNRPKSGFGIPVGDWLRGSLRPWAEDLISEDRINSDGIFHFDKIYKAWVEHISGDFDNTHKLWSILMFQSWLMEQRNK
jgi:asparagine synthase (glutamine-hydrolysing)